MRGIIPRYKIEQPNVFTGNVNHINIDRSIIGAVNTGSIEKLEVAMNNINNNLDNDTALQMKDFIEKVLQSEHLSQADKTEVIDQVSFVASEAVAPKESQKKAVVKSALKGIREAISTVRDLTTIWENLHQHLMKLFH